MASSPVRAERIGLLGGTFDPPHAGHLAAAVACRAALRLDRVLLMVANHPWQKAGGRDIAPAPDRLAMVEAMVQGVDGLEASDLEIERGGPSYTIETVEELGALARRAGRPTPEVYLVVGADLAGSLWTWRRVDELAQLVTLAIVSRPGSPPAPAPPGWRVTQVAAAHVDVSSSEIRRRLAQASSVTGLVPEQVVHCIRRRGLYAVAR